ncbi:hypothetical protein [Pseudomonas nitroreducens]|uniref:Fap system outer membrane protein n=1 Tax=Pseudomonas nitroreducens TaxID=46680 RepID=A0A6G6IXQ2_PSENT|nr:hypothetical protein [Pseudomonas nitroreducens]QIE87878.1 hypothetical protein G5B91_17015 [Pseudomonas nitroreducens]
MKRQLLLAASCLAASFQLPAATLLQPVELSDLELSQLRGRFVLPDRIISFGVTMSSIWQNANGQSLGAQVNMQVQNTMNLQTKMPVATPVFNVTLLNGQQNNQIATPPAGTGQVNGGAGLDQVQGIAQSVRTAGDYNQAGNDMTIDVKQADTAGPLPSGTSNLNQSVTTDAGTVAVAAANNGLQLSVQANGQGTALQTIGASGVAQAIALSGNANLVQNLANLSVVMKNNPTALNNINCALDQLRALRPTGY